ncbi:SGNH/GDSL hydrolase family protein [Pseudonocardia kunmingensis]|nr:SGNH/GDSL hydrolase family protein [Pseudonocardia kunmingensis]
MSVQPMTVQPLTVPPSANRPSVPYLSLAPAAPATTPRAVRVLAALGDSTAVGLGDPVQGGAWRGFAVLLAEALGAELVNPSFTGARMADVRRAQLPAAVAAAPDAAVVFVGMNDTLRSDFDPARLQDDCAATVAALREAGAHVVLVRYHDHTRVFPLPAPLRRALRRRVEALNAATAAVVAGEPAGIAVLDLDLLPGGYERASWAVDRLHPSERGHRLLAAGLAALLADAGFAVPQPVSPECGGGREVTALHRAAWLVFKGVPWLVRRGRDLGPVIVTGLVGEQRVTGQG